VLCSPLSSFSWCTKGIVTQPDCEERSDVAISSNHSVILRSVLSDVRISSFKVFMKKKT